MEFKDDNSILDQMLERLKTAHFRCAKCNKSMKDMPENTRKCPDCGYNVGMSSAMHVDKLFEGIEAPPELLREMKKLLESELS